MKIGIAIFTYNRSSHLQRLLAGLRKNRDVDNLYLFQDGLKCERHREEWNKVRNLLNQITWCEKKCIFSDVNKGLAKSLVDGINCVFQENDAAIILEDDCVPAQSFVSFMKQCFIKYQKNEKVYSVSGYSWPIKLKKNKYDIYGCGRVSSWGWGTWKDRWKQYDMDCGILSRLMNDEDNSYNLAVWGQDLEGILLDSVSRKNDSWAVYWALKIIEKEGICINPYRSLIENIGMDGTGVHCGITDKYKVEMEDGLIEKFELPDKIEILEETKNAFIEMYSGFSASVKGKKDFRENILVYGVGKFYLENAKEINEKYFVRGFIDKKRHGWFSGKKIIQSCEVELYEYDKIVIMVKDINEDIHIAKNLISQGIDSEKLILGHTLCGNYSETFNKISILSDGNLLVTVGNISLKVTSEDEFNHVMEVLVNQLYHYLINNDKKDIVLDVGMNIGDSALFFLQNDKVQKVYGYEPFIKTFLAAKNNLQKYVYDSEKLEIFNYGISNENARRIINFNCEMTCGMSTIDDIREKNYLFYKNEGLVTQNDEKEEIKVKKASEIFLPVIQKYSDYNIVLKMDCEGEEYCIIEELYKEHVLEKISFIMMEWHYSGNNEILHILEKVGFSYRCNNKSSNLGLIYAFKLIH